MDGRGGTIVIFDFDGTIADTLDLFIGAINKLAADFGYNRIRTEEIRGLRGKRPRQILVHLGISRIKLPFVLKRVRREINSGVAMASPAADLAGTLRGLKEGGCRIGILTSNTEQNVKEFLTANGLDVFDFLYSGSSIFGKGRVLKQIIRKNRQAKGRVFYVGDEIRDIDAAKAAGATMIAVTWGFNTAEALRREGADLLADGPGDILGAVLGRPEKE